MTSIYYSSQPSGPQPYGGIKSSITGLSNGALEIGPVRIPYLTIIALVIAVLMWIVWNKTRFGKYMFAVGGNPEAAKVSGVHVKKTLLGVYCSAFVLYAIAAVLEVGRIGSAANGTGEGYEMDAVAACVVGGVSLSGGVGTIPGVVVGVLYVYDHQLWNVIRRSKHVLAVHCKGSNHPVGGYSRYEKIRQKELKI